MILIAVCAGSWLVKSASQKLLHVKLGRMLAGLFVCGKITCGSGIRLLLRCPPVTHMLRAVFAENLEMSIIIGQGRLWCSEILKYLLGYDCPRVC